MRSPPSVPTVPSAPRQRDSSSALGRAATWRTLLAAARDRYGPVSRDGLGANAQILLSQNRLRLLVALGGAAVAGAWWAANPGVAAPAVVAVPAVLGAYAAAVAAVSTAVRWRGRAGLPAPLALGAADLGLIFAITATTSPPHHYARGLFLCLGALQFALGYLGAAPSVFVVAGSAVGYLALVATAVAHGQVMSWPEELWGLAIYLAVALHAVLLHARFDRRLATLVSLFAAAERGDFSHEYAEAPGQLHDGLTLLGRAYNHLRGELAALVLTDPLTGCLNRRGLEQELSRCIARAARTHGDVALLAVDVDHFKRINDTAGHLVGDVVLRELATVLVRDARTGDVVARVGGEEFVLLLPGADLEAAGVVAERVAAAVRRHAFAPVRGTPLRVTVSVGLSAEQVSDAGVSHALRARADEALYVAKRLGRDRVVLWAPGAHSRSTPVVGMPAIEAISPERLRRPERAD